MLECQVAGFVYFSDDSDDPLRRWDQRIESVCQRVNSIVDMIDKKGIKIETSVLTSTQEMAGPSSSS